MSFRDGSISFVPSIAIPGGPSDVVLQMEKLVKTEYDQGRGALCLLGSWALSEEHFAPYLPSSKYSSARHRVVFIARDHDPFRYIQKVGGRSWDMLELMESFPALKRGPQNSCLVDKDFTLQRERESRMNSSPESALGSATGTAQILDAAQTVAMPVPDVPFEPPVVSEMSIFSHRYSDYAYQSISSMPDYSHLSFEEIRLHQRGSASAPPPAGTSVATSRMEAGSKKPLTRYMRFASQQRGEILRHNPTLTFGEVGEALLLAWARLPDAEKAEFNVDPPGAAPSAGSSSTSNALTKMPAASARADASADAAGSASTAQQAQQADSCTPDASRVAPPGLFDGLVEVFPAAEGLVREEPSGRYTTLFAEYAKLENHISVGQRPIVDHHDAFVARFSTLYPNVLSRLQLVEETRGCGWFLAGGAVLRALLRRSWPGHDGDIDIFVYATTGSTAERQKKATALAKRLYVALAVSGEEWSVTRGRHVINLRRGPAFEDDTEVLQIVLRLYQSPAEVLLGFDIDACCVGFDGHTVRALPRAMRALRFGFVLCNPLHSWPNQPTYELRLAKYASRGFAVAVPGLNLAEVNLLQATSQGPLPQLRGVARLLLLHTDLLHRLKNAEATGQAMPTLRKMYGQLLIYTGYGPGAHDVCRTLPDEDDEDRLVNTWHFTSNVSPDEELARTDSTNASASLLVNPQLEIETDPSPVMDMSIRNELWRYILDSRRDNMQVPRRLEWATTPRSREYLNAKEANLDHTYFAPAYPPYGAEGERLARERSPFSAERPLPLAAAGPETPVADVQARDELPSAPIPTQPQLTRGILRDADGNPCSAPDPLPSAGAGPSQAIAVLDAAIVAARETLRGLGTPAAAPALGTTLATDVQSPAMQTTVVQARAEPSSAPTLTQAPRTRVEPDDDTAVRSLQHELDEALSAAAVVAVAGAGAPDSDDDAL